MKLCSYLLRFVKIFKKPVVFVPLTLYTLTFFIAMPVLSRNMKWSFYFHENSNTSVEVERLKMEANERILEAKDILSKWKKNNSDSFEKIKSNHDKVGIAVTIITTKRHVTGDEYEPQYLTQSLAAYVKLKAKKQTSNWVISICNVDGNPTNYQEVDLYKAMVPVFTHYSIQSPKPGLDIFGKENEDYVYCLNSTLKAYDPHFVLLVEDDTIPKPEFLDILSSILNQRLSLFYLPNSHTAKYIYSDETKIDLSTTAFIKLYHPPRLLQFYGSFEGISELVLQTVIFCVIIITCLRKCIIRQHISTSRTIFITIVTTAYIVLVSSLITRPHFLELRRISKYFFRIIRAPSCCTPAMLFPNQGGKIVAEFLSNVTCRNGYAKDSAIDDFLSSGNLSAYAVLPNLFTHIGLYSSVRDKVLNPYVV